MNNSTHNGVLHIIIKCVSSLKCAYTVKDVTVSDCKGGLLICAPEKVAHAAFRIAIRLLLSNVFDCFVTI